MFLRGKNQLVSASSFSNISIVVSYKVFLINPYRVYQCLQDKFFTCIGKIRKNRIFSLRTQSFSYKKKILTKFEGCSSTNMPAMPREEILLAKSSASFTRVGIPWWFVNWDTNHHGILTLVKPALDFAKLVITLGRVRVFSQLRLERRI